MAIATEDSRGPIPAHLRDDGVPVGTYVNGHNLGGEDGIMVAIKRDSSPRAAMAYRYSCVLKVEHDWQARAIAAILSAK